MAINFIQTASAQRAPDYAALLAAPDRSDADRQADKRRDPVAFLAFAGLRPGMKVLDRGAGAGYSTELVARVVGPTGVYGQNPPDNFERANALAARAATPAMRNGVAVLFAALKPGGVMVIADHAAKADSDISVGKTLRRIDESIVRREVEAAGFKLEISGAAPKILAIPRRNGPPVRSIILC
jgi:predicted methyltransferase